MIYIVVCVLKNLLRQIIAQMFSFGEESSFYGFVSDSLYRAISFLVLPLIAVATFSQHGGIKSMSLYTVIILVVFFALVRLIKGFQIASRDSHYHRGYIFLYFCALEFTPIIIGMKTTENYL